MEPTNRHPLDCITNQSGLSMLECLIPFVDYPLKLPLALFIKFNEIRMIINAFHSFDSISSLGLNATSNSPTDMLCALTGISPEMMNMLMSMTSGGNGGISPDILSGFSHAFSGMQGMNGEHNPAFVHGSENAKGYSPFTGSTNLNDNIANIFAEYDMEQVADYAMEQEPLPHNNSYHTYETNDFQNRDETEKREQI